MSVIEFKPYGAGYGVVHVMVGMIESFRGIDYNGNHGTELTLISGRKINVGEWQSDVALKIKNMREQA
jgi:hypothetical protein